MEGCVTRPLALICLTLITAHGQMAPGTLSRFDEYGAVNCEEEWARLDNYTNELLKTKTTKAVVIVYGGRRDTRRDEVQSRISFIKHYLTASRGIERWRLAIYNGGFRENFTTVLWVLPGGLDAKLLISPTVIGKDVKFKRGSVGNRVRNCSGIG